MRILRAKKDGVCFYAELEGDKVYPLLGAPYEGLQRDGRCFAYQEITLLPPCEPGKIVAVGLNYMDHIREMNDPLPDEPVLFMKPPSAMIASGETIILPKCCKKVDFEAELAVVIGKKCRNITPEQAKDVIFGYTCLNDVSCREIQKKDGQWIRAKGFDTFAPVGPWIETQLDPSDLKIQAELNGELRQDSTTAIMLFGAYALTAFVSSVMTLMPGDLISLGTPDGVGQLHSGDTIKIILEGIGTLENSVLDEGEERHV